MRKLCVTEKKSKKVILISDKFFDFWLSED